MKVLFISNYADGTGYAKAGEGLILSLDTVGIDVVPRKIQFNNRNDTHKRIQDLEQKSELNCDICIQHTLPSQFYYDGRFKKCIGSFDWETNTIPTSWVRKCNEMDEVWVVTVEQKNACIRSGISKPINIIPHATDINKFTKTYIPKLDFIKKLEEKPTFKFYTVGEFVKRKNHLALLRAFHSEFLPSENVDLVIKTSKEGLSPQECRDFVEQYCLDTKKGMRLYGNNIELYKKEIIITETMSEYDLMTLHKTCDAFVQPSYGEAFSFPAFDAGVLGNPTIVTGNGGYLYYANHNYMVNYHMEDVFGVADTHQDLYTAREKWCVVNLNDLKRVMRKVYEDKSKRILNLKLAESFSYESIGKQLIEILKG